MLFRSDPGFLGTLEPAAKPSPRAAVLDFFAGRHVAASNEAAASSAERRARAMDLRPSLTPETPSPVHESRAVTPATDVEGIRVQSTFVGDDYYKQLHRDRLGPTITSSNVSVQPESLCVVCFEQRPTMAVNPCGHRCLCVDDAPRFVGTACPICRGPVLSILAIFDS